MVREIDVMNREMIKHGKKYVLIGPGRWGTRDKWIGIPVNWSQISNARIIVETSLDDYPLDASAYIGRSPLWCWVRVKTDASPILKN